MFTGKYVEILVRGSEGTSGLSLVSYTDIKVNGQMFETVQHFKYLGVIVSDEGSRQEVLTRIAQTPAALTCLKPICKDRNIILGENF